MTSKERVRKAILKQNPDRIPVNYSSTGYVKEKLMKHYGYDDFELVLQRFGVDIRNTEPEYSGPALKPDETPWGNKIEKYWTGTEWYSNIVYRPLEQCKTIDDLKKYKWPSADDFDYEGIKRFCDKHPDKAISIGYIGVFQIACDLRGMENLFIDMSLEPESAHYIFDRMLEFELEYYERMLIAGDGQIDILRTCDDYGTQNSLLLSVPMWNEYFKNNLKKLVDLAHLYDAFYLQHSCGAIRDIIPGLIECGVDILDPIQKVNGMEPELLKRDFGDKLTFHGGIDTQDLLPNGTPEMVRKETRRIINVFHDKGGYILMASQGIQRDVPIENIEAMFNAYM